MSGRDQDGWTSLHWATLHGHLDLVRWLVDEKQVDPSCQSREGWTPLHVASQNGHLDIVRWLVEKQWVDPLCQDKEGLTPRHVASRNDHLDIVRWLANAENQASHQDYTGTCSYDLGSDDGHAAVLKNKEGISDGECHLHVFVL